MLNRTIDLPIAKHSFFLFGPRQTGKTTLVEQHLASVKQNVISINLLLHDQFIKYKTNPSQLRSEIDFLLQKNKKAVLFIDEIQKLPELLDESHALLEKHKTNLTIIFTGSSARKLKRVSTNLLGGRAWSFALFPFTHCELAEHFSLETVLHYGSLPPLLDLKTNDKIRTLNAYSQTYLKEEIFDEALVRNIGAFSRFFELAADNSGEIVNYTTIARETGVASKTIKEYYQILEDTLIAFRLEPFLKSMRKRLIQHSKYYLFDTGIINSLCGRLQAPIKKRTHLYGTLFEHFIILEMTRLIRYKELPWRMYYWKTSHGAEVDLIVEIPGKKIYAIEIKSAENVEPKSLTGLKQFISDNPDALAVCVCTTKTPYLKNNITFLPWQYFFSDEMKLC